MLAVHWAPVSKTKHILRNGIRKSPNGLYCFPLTGHKGLDRWWVYFFNQCRVRARKKYNGIVFHIEQEDFPAYFGHWIGATNRHRFTKEITSVKDLGKEFRRMAMLKLGQIIAWNKGLDKNIYDADQQDALYLKLAEQELEQSSGSITPLLNNLDFMTLVIQDHQLVLSHSIPAKRIIKVMPQGDEFGRVHRLNKRSLKYRYTD
ncbi:MAG: hypothetical protein JNM21_10970 [Taibaiella sp.]|nr:hypothetical protein [Taibaiella sp.]